MQWATHEVGRRHQVTTEAEKLCNHLHTGQTFHIISISFSLIVFTCPVDYHGIWIYCFQISITILVSRHISSKFSVIAILCITDTIKLVITEFLRCQSINSQLDFLGRWFTRFTSKNILALISELEQS